jgi:hypothetical protein
MKLKEKIFDWLNFFPIQLFLAHLRKNQMFLILWLILFGFVTQSLASMFGVPYLFLTPEYLGENSFFAYSILGFAMGGFFMAYHLYSYVIIGPTFPFIASLSRPFFKFCINNSLIPTIFYITLVYNIAQIEMYEEFLKGWSIVYNIIGLTLGIIAFIVLAMFYFFSTNKGAERLSKSTNGRFRSIFQKTHSFIQLEINERQTSTYYMSNFFKIKHTRDVDHYDNEMLNEVFRQNHFNATLFEVLTVLSFILIGVFQNYEFFVIPAAASILLLFTIFIMIISFMYSWFKGWTFIIVLVFGFCLNFLASKTDFIKARNYAYGLNYDSKVEYSLKKIKDTQFNSVTNNSDLKHHELILDKWKNKAEKLQGVEKPKLILVNVSGGGLRSAMWTFNVLQSLDKKLNGDFMKNVHLITGASGGMIGASYYRDVLREQNHKKIIHNGDSLLNNISKDLLNRVAFSLVTHDMFLRHKKVIFNGREYAKDRGFYFEQELNQNTNGIMNYTLGDYYLQEKKSEIPLMLFTPTIINDGRRMLIAPQPYGFMNGNVLTKSTGPENIEYIKLFENNEPLATSYLSVLRANATFPYILPMVSLPTSPEIALMDAGIRDNYGTKSTVRYIDALSEWINENTSGVVIVQIRDIVQDYDLESQEEIALIDKIIEPALNFYGNFHHSQEYNASELLDLSKKSGFPINVVTFALRNTPKDKIALSWHLTLREKNIIKKSFDSQNNQDELKKMINLLKKGN